MGIKVKEASLSNVVDKEAMLRSLIEEQADNEYLSDFECTIHADAKNKIIRAEVSCMYELGSFLTFDFLCKISDLLQTKSIDLEDQYHIGGCETCDYGSTSSATIVIRDAVF